MMNQLQSLTQCFAQLSTDLKIHVFSYYSTPLMVRHLEDKHIQADDALMMKEVNRTLWKQLYREKYTYEQYQSHVEGPKSSWNWREMFLSQEIQRMRDENEFPSLNEIGLYKPVEYICVSEGCDGGMEPNIEVLSKLPNIKHLSFESEFPSNLFGLIRTLKNVTSFWFFQIRYSEEELSEVHQAIKSRMNQDEFQLHFIDCEVEDEDCSTSPNLCQLLGDETLNICTVTISGDSMNFEECFSAILGNPRIRNLTLNDIDQELQAVPIPNIKKRKVEERDDGSARHFDSLDLSSCSHSNSFFEELVQAFQKGLSVRNLNLNCLSSSKYLRYISTILELPPRYPLCSISFRMSDAPMSDIERFFELVNKSRDMVSLHLDDLPRDQSTYIQVLSNFISQNSVLTTLIIDNLDTKNEELIDQFMEALCCNNFLKSLTISNRTPGDQLVDKLSWVLQNRTTPFTTIDLGSLILSPFGANTLLQSINDRYSHANKLNELVLKSSGALDQEQVKLANKSVEFLVLSYF